LLAVSLSPAPAFAALAHREYFDNNKNMETISATAMLAALAQETRLAIFRLLVEAGPEGMNAGAIAESLRVPAATLSFHVAQLSRAGLVLGRQESRFVFYSANFAAMDDLVAFLTDNCCRGGEPCLPKTRQAAEKRHATRRPP
jgi:DNA-binding transcriptional ArsR family regulator